MVALQILSRVILNKDNSIIDDNSLTREYFAEYEKEYDFIQEHLSKYGNVPDRETFLSFFPNLQLVEVRETDKYLVDTIKEEYLFSQTKPVIMKAAELMSTDSNSAVNYLYEQIEGLRRSTVKAEGIDIIATAEDRYQQFLDRKNNFDKWYFTTGFKELDDVIGGLRRDEEFLVIYARINEGKSFILQAICTHLWKLGNRCGLVSPEMSVTSIGYRFDTLYKHFSNGALMWGNGDLDEDEYKSYSKELSHKSGFIVATPEVFDRRITVSKLRKWVIDNKLDVLAIDGISYLTDERYARGDSKATSLTNISEDLKILATELKVPIIAVVQANRGGVRGKDNDDTPGLDNIKDSDGIGACASKTLAIKQKNGVVIMEITKNRDGKVNVKLHYAWDIDTGVFEFIPTEDDAEATSVTKEKLETTKKKLQTSTDIF